jgi:hypothetical protein
MSGELAHVPEGTVIEVVGENLLEEVEIRNRGVGVSQSGLDYNKRRKLVEKFDWLPA